MPEYQGQLRATGRLAIVVSQYNERVTGKLLEGAVACAREARLADDAVDVVWVPGAFELPGVSSALAATGRYSAIVCLGAVIRGETAHFDFVAGEAARGINEVAIRTGIPVAFGVLTTDTMEQALARA
ncbi:MAG TPA: 6,7-dimethyl-8-ribityllumazine synthase, partial [Gemmatimonadales bacterium]|nr:6,7-dimethyl-8-ribityllumazine synthase [Gemmatimonadales bacterium]